MPNELRIFVPIAIRAIMNSLISRIEATAGISVTQMIDLNPAISERISAGEAYDIGLTNPHYAKALIAAGQADGAYHRAFGRVPLAVGRKAGSEGAIRKDLHEIEALFCAAESIAYTGAGTSGRTYLDVMERLGLTKAALPKSLAMEGGGPVASVARGQTELAVAPLTTVLSTPGVVLAAVFPGSLKVHIDISIFFSPDPRSGAVAALEFLTASKLDDELAAAGVRRFELD